MTSEARRLFALLGQLPAGLIAEDRDALLGGDGFDAEEVLLRLALAVQRHGRLDLLSPIRQHAARRHAPAAPDDSMWPEFFIGLTQRLGETIGTREGEGAVARLAPEYPNIEAAIRAAIAGRRRAYSMAALEGIGRLISFAFLPVQPLTELAEASQVVGDVRSAASCMTTLGDIALDRSEHDVARKAYEKALELYRKDGSVIGEANSMKSLGDTAVDRSDHEGARKAYDKALQLYREVDDLLGEANCTLRLGDIALDHSEHEGARKAYEEALSLYRDVGDILGEANCVKRLGDIALAGSDHERALTSYHDALRLYRQTGSARGEANCLKRLGDIALDRFDTEAARNSYQKALSLYREIGDLNGEAECLETLEQLT
jgi:tetratricopeptide (TPR) repeat protein